MSAPRPRAAAARPANGSAAPATMPGGVPFSKASMQRPSSEPLSTSAAAAGTTMGQMPSPMPGVAQVAQMAQLQQMQQMQMQMQAAAMMQMQMGAMAQMQMAAMMPMMQMGMQMAPMMPMGMQMAPIAGQEQPVEEEDLGPCSPEDIAALELDIKEEEKAAKITAKKSGSFVGLMARYIEDEGFGFISCPECKDVWDKSDIFVSGRNFMSSGIEVGDVVTFQVEKDGKDLPRAVNPKTLPELTKSKKKLSKMRDVAKASHPLKRSAPALPPGPLPEAKRPSLGHFA
mmetsp:Transcript_41869/g.112895  ORF Transcript_41869/g.112895 Transcript_41869/m.112895 type:complete len:286 (-) Transcript_41869:32-889(-)